MFRRAVSVELLAGDKNVLLLGPRQTGKSTLLRTLFAGCPYIDLLASPSYRLLSGRPERVAELIGSDPGLVVIDEIQRIPELLNEVQRIVTANPSWHFILTGSSARKLRARGTNLLGGRARLQRLHPLTSQEIQTYEGTTFATDDLIAYGGLPFVLLSDQPERALNDYLTLYLEEEIRAESLVRNLGAFSRFLETAALTNGEQVVFSSVASDAEVPARTVREYYRLLEDTLVGELLLPYRKTKRRKAVATAKFFFFDVGVANAFLGRVGVRKGDGAYGRTLEHFIYTELTAFLSYSQHPAGLHYWRSRSQLEVDFVVAGSQDPLLAVEVKASQDVGAKDLRGIRALRQEFPNLPSVVVYGGATKRVFDDDIQALPLDGFLDALWNGKMLPGRA